MDDQVKKERKIVQNLAISWLFSRKSLATLARILFKIGYFEFPTVGNTVLIRVRLIYIKQREINWQEVKSETHRIFSKKFSLITLKVIPGHPEVNKVSIFDAVSVFLYLLKD